MKTAFFVFEICVSIILKNEVEIFSAKIKTKSSKIQLMEFNEIFNIYFLITEGNCRFNEKIDRNIDDHKSMTI